MKNSGYFALCAVVSFFFTCAGSENETALRDVKRICGGLHQILKEADRGDISHFFAIRYFLNKVQDPAYEMKHAPSNLKTILQQHALLDKQGRIILSSKL